MIGNEDRRLTLRKKIFDLKEEVTSHAYEAQDMGEEVRLPLRIARNALFEAWTLLAVPLEEAEEEH